MALQIGGQVIPIHPLDVVPSVAKDDSFCIGSFVPSGPISKDLYVLPLAVLVPLLMGIF